MVWVLKMLFKVTGYVLFYTFAIALGIVITSYTFYAEESRPSLRKRKKSLRAHSRNLIIGKIIKDYNVAYNMVCGRSVPILEPISPIYDI